MRELIIEISTFKMGVNFVLLNNVRMHNIHAVQLVFQQHNFIIGMRYATDRFLTGNDWDI